jgi:hypothetical protein
MAESYVIVADQRGCDFVSFSPDVPSCVGLPMRPQRFEPELNTGEWLVLAYAVWSKSDLDSIQLAIKVRARLNREIKLGVRPFNAFDEFKSWCPGLRKEYRSPIWLVFRDGVRLQEFVGLQGEDDLATKIANCLRVH